MFLKLASLSSLKLYNSPLRDDTCYAYSLQFIIISDSRSRSLKKQLGDSQSAQAMVVPRCWLPVGAGDCPDLD